MENSRKISSPPNSSDTYAAPKDRWKSYETVDIRSRAHWALSLDSVSNVGWYKKTSVGFNVKAWIPGRRWESYWIKK